MMDTMTKTSIWSQAGAIQLAKKEAKALKRNKPLKTYSSKEVLALQARGWEVLSHIQPSYGQGQYWLMTKTSA